MIIVKVNGGLGNQMFQYALARALSRDAKPYLDLSFFDLPPGAHTARPFGLDIFTLHYERATTEQLVAFATARNSRLKRMWGRSFPAFTKHHFFTERRFSFDPSVLKVADHTYIEGHWQSEKYFIAVEDRIRRDLCSATEPDMANRAMALRIQATRAISVHVRRGDYIHHAAANAVHGTCDADYYARAMRRMKDQHPDATFFIFSDDQDWARAELDPSYAMVFVDLNDSEHGYEDMRLMSLCRHHIIANSSFSWWGAWLNPDPKKLVIAPSRWFIDPAIDTKDLLPAGWIKL